MSLASPLLLLTLLSVPAQAAAPHAQVEAVPQASALVPGEPLELALRFTMEEGWHIYWSHPGDSGLAPSAKVLAPEGATLSELLHPAPTRHVDPGNVITHVHEGVTVLFTSLTPPPDLPPRGHQEISLELAWLACRSECVRETQTLTFAMKRSAKARAERRDEVAAHRELLPRQDDGAWSWEWTGDAVRFSVDGGAALDFFPFSDTQLNGLPEQTEDTLRVPLRPGAPLGGVLLVRANSGKRAYTVNLSPSPLPPDVTQDRDAFGD